MVTIVLSVNRLKDSQKGKKAINKNQTIEKLRAIQTRAHFNHALKVTY